MQQDSQPEKQPPGAAGGVIILDRDAIRKALQRIAHEIIERNESLDSLILAGVPLRGVEIARRLASILGSIEGCEVPVGVIDVSMHRDDLAIRSMPPAVRASHLPCDPTGKVVVLVDDVFYTGRTARAALDALHSYGRPSRVQLAVLVDRGHRELPIRPDYVGKNLPTSRQERVMVRLDNVDPEGDSVRLQKA